MTGSVLPPRLRFAGGSGQTDGAESAHGAIGSEAVFGYRMTFAAQLARRLRLSIAAVIGPHTIAAVNDSLQTVGTAAAVGVSATFRFLVRLAAQSPMSGRRENVHMIGVGANAIAAAMVQLHPGGDGAAQMFIDEPVNHCQPAVKADLAIVAGATPTGPFPAARRKG